MRLTFVLSWVIQNKIPPFVLVRWSTGPLVLWSLGPLVPWSSGPLVLWSLGPWYSGPGLRVLGSVLSRQDALSVIVKSPGHTSCEAL